jgi:RNA recognition motif-containing protein
MVQSRFGYIDFKIPDAAKAALKMNGKEVKGRKITVVRLTIGILCEK